MADVSGAFRYVAVDAAGRRVRGVLSAETDAIAYEQLRREGLSPVSLKTARSTTARQGRSRQRVTDRETADLLGNLAELLKAGADMRTALEILGARGARPAVGELCRRLLVEISGGEALERAFAAQMTRNQGFVGAMVAAGEAGGNLPESLARAAAMIDARVRLRAKFISILAYPAFVLISTVAAVLALLLFVVPALEPLARDSGAATPGSLAGLIAASSFLRTQGRLLAMVLAGALAAGLLAKRAGALTPALERLALDGPARGAVRGLVFGGFAITLGGMLAAGAPMSDALYLSVRSVTSKLARARLEPVLQSVRQGQPLSKSLEDVGSFPRAVVRLAMVGESTGTLGQMVARGGQLEEEAAVGRIEVIGQLVGPAMIVGLGGIVGLVMAGLLSGVSQLGQSTLN